uniref:HTH myb-type domain-containing protein n=1 Tax=Oryza glumipatula TaxID=40148 RepID=A0A0D9ZJ47_9ORYZ
MNLQDCPRLPVYTNAWRKSGGGGRYDGGKSCSKAEQERRKGIPWTEEEHRYVYTRDSGNQDEQLLFVFFLGTQLAPLLDLLRDASESMAVMSCDCDWIVRRLFLLGLDKFGKGDLQSISRNFVISRTPTQVASHAQKYFIRLNSMNRDRRRSSIHDITSVTAGDAAAQQGPITGQAKAALRRRSGHRA